MRNGCVQKDEKNGISTPISFVSNGSRTRLNVTCQKILLLLFLGSIITGCANTISETNQSHPSIPDNKYANEIDVGKSPVIGQKDAPVTIVMFLHYDCIYSRSAYDTIQRILLDSPNDIRVVFKHSFSPKMKDSSRKHLFAELIKQDVGEDEFWQVSNWLFTCPDTTYKKLEEQAGRYGMSMERFNSIIDDEQSLMDLFHADLSLLDKFNITHTPVIFINNDILKKRSSQSYLSEFSVYCYVTSPDAEVCIAPDNDAVEECPIYIGF